MKNNKKIIVLIFVIVISVALIICGIYLAYRNYTLSHATGGSSSYYSEWEGNNVVDIDSYGFDYEYGWSSVDLWPYHIENPENKLTKLDEPSTFRVKEWDDMPVLDGAEAAYPVYSAFANYCYEDINVIQENNSEYKPVQFTNTIEAYKKLIKGKVDVFFGAKPSQKQLELAKKKNKELVLTPIGREAFVFFVSKDNKIDNLTSEQIRKIYSGEYTNWKSVEGKNMPILAFQRPENSGSQTMMQYFMGDTPLKEPLEIEYSAGMGGVIREVAEYENKDSSIGYSFRYFVTKMENSYSDDIKLLSIDEIAPTKENIANGTYPLTTNLYAITIADNEKETVHQMVEWMKGKQAQKIVEKTGYVLISE